jgi:uncharacterized protein
VTGALLVSIHDVAPRWLAEVTALREALGRWGVDRATLLAVPHFHQQQPLGEHAPTVAWLRQRIASGDEVALHGYYHLQAGTPTGAIDRIRAAMWTAGEGECLRPSRAMPELLERGRDHLIRALGVVPAGFVAPAWLEPRGFAALLARHGFRWHETSLYVEDLRAQRRLLTPVIGYATRTPLREQLSITWGRALTAAARVIGHGPTRVARVAVHPADLRSRRVMAELERVVRALAAQATPTTTVERLSR